MKTLLALLLACAVCLPALGQERAARDRNLQKQGLQPHERMREERRELRRERPDRAEGRHFSREERQRLRQDLIDANRSMKGRR
ncbi:MAG TPA: hypothetical protein VFB53_11085 [Burkholderiales bacterium]|nr:hypothetical protein [Burkholderiales bacterium]